MSEIIINDCITELALGLGDEIKETLTSDFTGNVCLQFNYHKKTFASIDTTIRIHSLKKDLIKE